MTSTILLKRSLTAGAVPTASQLALGELAVNLADGYAYLENTTGAVVRVGTTADRVKVDAISDMSAGSLQSALTQIYRKASSSNLGLVKVGSGLAVGSDGTLSVSGVQVTAANVTVEGTTYTSAGDLQTLIGVLGGRTGPLAALLEVNLGKLGIGTDTPSDFVHMSNAGATTLRVTNSSNNVSSVLSSGTTASTVGTITAHPFSVVVNSQNAAVFDTGRRMTLPSQTRFHAYKTIDISTDGTATQAVIPNGTSLNVGTAYSTSTGRFTAPVTGAYFIYAQAYFIELGEGGLYSGWLIRKNGTGLPVLESFGSKGTDNKDLTVYSGRLVQLNAGDYLEMLLDTDTAGVTVSKGEGETFFGGYLVG